MIFSSIFFRVFEQCEIENEANKEVFKTEKDYKRWKYGGGGKEKKDDLCKIILKKKNPFYKKKNLENKKKS